MMPATTTATTGPYSSAAEGYWAAGWRGILPLPAGRKKPVPSGYTGRGGADPSYPDVYAWTETEGGGNIALRMPHDVVGLDVDDYGDKAGVATLALHEQMHGALPATWRSTSRDTRLGGIRFYRVPPGLEWPGELDGGGIEIIQRHHRYAVVGPSVHPEGGTYRWYDPDGTPSLSPPRPDQLPALPEQWVTDLTGNRLAGESTKLSVDDQAAIGWLTTQLGAQDDPCPVMQGVLNTYRTSGKSAHGAMVDAILTAVRYAEGHHPGGVGVVVAIRRGFIERVTSPMHEHPRSRGEAEHEYMRSLTGAVGICLGDPGPATCDCYGQLTSLIVGAAVAPAAALVEPDQVAPVVDLGPAPLPAAAPLEPPRPAGLEKLTPGDQFILDAPAIAPAIWGSGDSILWAKGESLVIAGPPGVGKTTLVGQIVRGRLGLGGRILGYPVAPTGSRVLYLAMDRPAQIARSLRRQFDPAERAILAERLMVWVGPPPMDVARNPHIMRALAELAGADTVIVDSLKDAAIGLVEDEVGAGYNRARQTCLANGIEVLELHHMVKRGDQGRKPNTLADVYGSMHITSGAGSVIVLWGAGGDLVVDLLHLKQPMEDCGPMQIEHDHEAGLTTVSHGTDLLSLVAAAGRVGLSAVGVAQAMFGHDEVTRNEKQKATRALQKLAGDGHLEAFDGPLYHGQAVRMYRAAAQIEGTNEGTRPFSGSRVREGTRGYADSVSPSPEGTPEGTEGTRLEGTRGDTPERGVTLPRRTGPTETLAACRECYAPANVDDLIRGGGVCPDCRGRRDQWGGWS